VTYRDEKFSIGLDLIAEKDAEVIHAAVALKLLAIRPISRACE
jgi:hypothetical protein